MNEIAGLNNNLDQLNVCYLGTQVPTENTCAKKHPELTEDKKCSCDSMKCKLEEATNS